MSKKQVNLATVELIASSQDYKDGSQTLLANVWFPPQEGAFAIDGKTITMRYGFAEATLQITDSYNSSYHDIRKILLAEETVTISSENVRKDEKGLGGGFSLPKNPFAKANVGASTQRELTTVVKSEANQTRAQYIAEEVDKGQWRLRGCGHEDGLLDGTIIHSDGGALCTLKWALDKASAGKALTISAKISTVQRHLRVVIVDDDHGRTLANNAERAAVVNAVIARALRNRQVSSNPDDEGKTLSLASDTVTVQPQKATSDA